jgi:hypothetical protein
VWEPFEHSVSPLVVASAVAYWRRSLFAGSACPFPHTDRSTQNWCGQEESDCLIKTKHCDKRKRFLRNVISAQCSECHCDEIRPSAGKRRE